MILAAASPTGSVFLDQWGAICLVIVAVAAALEIGRRTLKALIKLTQAVNAVYDLAAIAPDLQTIARELSSNGGASLKDAVVRQEKHMQAQAESFTRISNQVQENSHLINEVSIAQRSHLKLAHHSDDGQKPA